MSVAGGGIYFHPTPGSYLKPYLASFSTSLSFCEAAFFFALSFADEGDWQLVNTGRHTPRANKAISVGFIATDHTHAKAGVNGGAAAGALGGSLRYFFVSTYGISMINSPAEKGIQ